MHFYVFSSNEIFCWNLSWSYHEISVFSSILSFTVQCIIGPCHKRINEQPGQPKICTNAFKEAVRRQALKLRNKNERITPSKVKIAGKLSGSCKIIQRTLNEVKLSFIRSKQKITLIEKQWNVREKYIKDWTSQGIHFKNNFCGWKKFNLGYPVNFKNW